MTLAELIIYLHILAWIAFSRLDKWYDRRWPKKGSLDNWQKQKDEAYD